jgi:PTH1 family peptidyl-tRNA hydrolase
MKLIVGLGNPGRNYLGTRHNIGSLAVTSLAQESALSLKKGFLSSSESAKARIEGVEVILAVPRVYMNLSGEAVRQLVKKNRVALEDLLVVHDELDLDLGRVRLKSGGSAAGHNGLKSVIGSLGDDGFSRLRIGIGRPPRDDADMADYVLSGFPRKDKEPVDQAVQDAIVIMKLWVKDGISKTMNVVNR